MELITAIALLCQLNVGIGTGHKSYHPEDGYAAIVPKIIEEQKSCQKELARCILRDDKNADDFRMSTALSCVESRF